MPPPLWIEEPVPSYINRHFGEKVISKPQQRLQFFFGLRLERILVSDFLCFREPREL
jgi:hypothetical protein